MSFLDIVKVSASIVFSIACGSGIIWTVAKSIASRTADVLQAKIQAENQAKIDKQIEEFKAQLEDKSHIYRQSFDVEFITYQELCSAFFAMISAAHWLFPSGIDRAPATGEWKEICNERYKTAQETYNVAISLLGSKAPFIAEDTYTSFHEIIKLVARQINDYAWCEPWNRDDRDNECREIEKESFKRTHEIDQKWSMLLCNLRKYIASMK